MMHIRISRLVRAPRAIVMGVYADYEKWPQLFSTIRAVRLLRRDGEKLILAIDHEEGPVINELLVQPPGRIDLQGSRGSFRRIVRRPASLHAIGRASAVVTTCQRNGHTGRAGDSVTWDRVTRVGVRPRHEAPIVRSRSEE